MKIKQGVFTLDTLMPFVYRAAWGKDTGGHFTSTDNELLGLEVLDKADLKKLIQDIVGGK